MEYQLIASPLPTSNKYTVTERILANRGLMPNMVHHYLHTTDEDIIAPDRLMNVAAGAKMLIEHISQGHNILVQVDSDCDGYTSAAALINYLNMWCPNFVHSHIYYRLHTGKQHGIIPDTVPDNIQLVIAPDSSSNDYEQHKELKNRGIDVLVIDHHEAEKVSEDACIINNQLCDYPTKSLSGVGVVFKFCSYIDSILETEYANDLLDLVAVGMIADMMDLRDFETKRLIDKGLNAIRNPFIKSIVRAQDYSISKGGGLCPFTVSFYIAPMINAMIRVGTATEKLMLFEAMLDYKGYEQIPSGKRGAKGQFEARAIEAARICSNVKNRQKKTQDSSAATIEAIIEKNNLLDNKLLVVRLDPNQAVDKNLTGLIANQLMAKYQRPILLLNQVINEETQVKSWEGSGRGYEKSKLDSFREFLADSGYVMYAQGHANAFGAGILDDNFEAFMNYSNEALKDFDFHPCYKVDIVYQGNDFSTQDILGVTELKTIWGQNIDEPYFAFENIKVTKENLVLMSPDKNPTLKITLPNGTSIIKFKASQEEFDRLYTEMGCTTINLVGKCERNVWNGRITPQILVEDYEIVNQTKYYF